MSNISIWSIDKTLSGATTLDQSEPGSSGNKGVLHIPQSSRTEGSLSNCLVLYILIGGWGLTPWQKCSQCILHSTPVDWASFMCNGLYDGQMDISIV